VIWSSQPNGASGLSQELRRRQARVRAS
jgi:hypothetical protein